jgi:mRNA export factor
MDTKEKLLVVAIADRWIQIINLDNPTASYKEIKGP